MSCTLCAPHPDSLPTTCYACIGQPTARPAGLRREAIAPPPPVPAGPAPAATSAIVALVFSILFPILGLGVGLWARARIKASDGQLGGLGLTTAAIWISITTLLILWGSIAAG